MNEFKFPYKLKQRTAFNAQNEFRFVFRWENYF